MEYVPRILKVGGWSKIYWKFSNFLYLTIKKKADFKHIAQTYSNVIASLNECLLKSNKCKISKLEKRKNKIKQNSIGANSTSRTFVLHCMHTIPFNFGTTFHRKKTSVRFVSIGISVYNYNKKVNMSIVFKSVLTDHFEYYLAFYIKKNIDTIHFDNFLYLIAASFFVNKITSGNIVRNINKDNCKTKNSNNNLC